MLFANASAPTGWRIETDNDTMVRIVSSLGGATSGTNGMADAMGGAAAVSTDNFTLLATHLATRSSRVSANCC